jgi:hypothetical protein
MLGPRDICRSFARYFSFSSPDDGRWISVAILSTYFLTFAWTFHAKGRASAWWRMGVPPGTPSFFDMRFVTGTMDSVRAGYDPYVENVRDVWQRRMNYPRVWLLLERTGLGDPHAVAVAVVLSAAYFLSALYWAGRTNPIESVILGAFLCSPHLMWVVERGNVDMALFVMLASTLALARRRPRAKPLVYLAILVTAVLKLFTVAAVLVATRERSWRRAAVAGGVAGGGFVAYLAATWSDLALTLAGTPKSTWWSYGRMVLFDTIAQQHSWGLPHVPLTEVAPASVALVAVVAIAGALTAVRIRAVPTPSDRADGFLAGAGIYAGTFLIGSNFDYKLIFLVLTLPLTFEWARRRGGIARLGYGLLAATLTSAWTEVLLAGRSRVEHAPLPAILAQDAANWVLLYFAVAGIVAVVGATWRERIASQGHRS